MTVKNAFVRAAFELQSSRVFQLHIHTYPSQRPRFHSVPLFCLAVSRAVNAEDTVIFHMRGPLPPVFFCRSIKRACAHKASSYQEQPNRHQRSRKEQLHRAIYYKIKSDPPIQFII